MRRRTMLLGLGALVFGSGATSVNAAFSESINTDSASSLEMYAVSDLVLTRGDDTGSITNSGGDSFDYTSDTFGSISTKSDVPQAYVNSAQNGNLVVKTATLIEGTSTTYPHLVEVTNNGDTTESLGFGYNSFNSSNVDTDGDASEPVSQSDVQDMYSFQVNGSKSTASVSVSGGTDISPSSSESKDTPQAYQDISPGDTIAVDLVVDPSVNISDLRAAVGNPSGNPFSGNPVSAAPLIESVTAGIQ